MVYKDDRFGEVESWSPHREGPGVKPADLNSPREGPEPSGGRSKSQWQDPSGGAAPCSASDPGQEQPL